MSKRPFFYCLVVDALPSVKFKPNIVATNTNNCDVNQSTLESITPFGGMNSAIKPITIAEINANTARIIFILSDIFFTVNYLYL